MAELLDHNFRGAGSALALLVYGGVLPAQLRHDWGVRFYRRGYEGVLCGDRPHGAAHNPAAARADFTLDHCVPAE
jgi:hypothetical protein